MNEILLNFTFDSVQKICQVVLAWIRLRCIIKNGVVIWNNRAAVWNILKICVEDCEVIWKRWLIKIKLLAGKLGQPDKRPHLIINILKSAVANIQLLNLIIGAYVLIHVAEIE